MHRIAAYAWEKGGSKQVAYRASDGHIHELFVVGGGSWSHADLTEITGAPQPDTDTRFSGYEWHAGNSKQVVYTTRRRTATFTNSSWLREGRGVLQTSRK